MVYSDVLLIIRQEHVKQLFQCYLSISPLFKRKDTNVVQVFKYAPLVNPCVTETFPSYYLNIWPRVLQPQMWKFIKRSDVLRLHCFNGRVCFSCSVKPTGAGHCASIKATYIVYKKANNYQVIRIESYNYILKMCLFLLRTTRKSQVIEEDDTKAYRWTYLLYDIWRICKVFQTWILQITSPLLSKNVRRR